MEVVMEVVVSVFSGVAFHLTASRGLYILHTTPLVAQTKPEALLPGTRHRIFQTEAQNAYSLMQQCLEYLIFLNLVCFQSQKHAYITMQVIANTSASFNWISSCHIHLQDL